MIGRGAVRSVALVVTVTLAGCGGDDDGDADDTSDGAPPPADASVDGGAGTDASPDGGSLICDAPLSCPDPGADEIAVCGRIVDIETSELLRAEGATGSLCSPGAPAASGPCALTVEVHDAVEFAGNPGGAAPLAADIELDDCGRFRFASPRPANGVTAVVLAGAAVRRSFSFFAVAGGEQLTLQEIFHVRSSTDEAWSSSAGLVGETFADQGVIVAVVRHAGAPHAGVTLVSEGAPITANDYYFADADPSQRTEVDPELVATGANGTALIADRPGIASYSGDVESAPEGCTWEVQNGAAVAGAVMVLPVESACSR